MRTIRLLYKTRFIFYTSLFIIFYNEFLTYWLSYINWPLLKSTSNNDIRLLLVADPQLIGDNDEPWYLKSIAKWDSDRYLKNTYRLALSYTNPNLILFLGDLFDEGLKSTDDQFNDYYNRFSNIFKLNEILNKKNNNITILFLSGDNDIGGEYYNDRNEKLEKRFVKYFGSLIKLNNYKYLSILKLDLDKSSSFYTKNKRDHVRYLLKNHQDSNDNFFIILNHMTIFGRHDNEVSRLIDDTNAGLVIKGDDHTFYIAKYNALNHKIESYIDYNSNSTNFYSFNLQTIKSNKNIKSFYEISIPTCSYRMGVPQMGFGVLTINENGNAYVQILWLPSRYACLYLYLVFIIIVMFMIFSRYFFNFVFNLRKTNYFL